MEDEIKTWLSDIKQAIKEINDFLPDKKDFFQFLSPQALLKRTLRPRAKYARGIYEHNSFLQTTTQGPLQV